MALSKRSRNLMLAATLLVPGMLQAEDIDLFQGGADITGNKPNVLIIVDNSANWNSSAQHWPGGIKQGESELNAMSTVLGTLTGDVRVGVMMFVKAATNGGGNDGGYVRFAVRDMDSTNRTAVQTMLNGIKPDFNNENTGQQVATANTDYGAAMYEAYKYFSGSTRYGAAASLRDYTGNGSYSASPYTAGDLAGNAFSSAASNTYVTPLDATRPCSKNYIIFIGNGFPSTDSVNPTTLGDATLTNFNATAIYNEGTKTTYADEWSRFLKQYGTAAPCRNVTDDDGNTTQVCANGKIVTYTIDVYKDAQDVAETNLLKSMAQVGGGKYFAATSESQIRTALTNIFNEIQAVNSVFTSASLPVSVNTQGTYLNQIYMGVFRPDGGGRPRWLGNLKQYKFGITQDAQGKDQIFLSDADGQAAVNQQSGFISPTARSYWTSSTAPNPGFWAFNPQGPGGQYDSPDGDLVEKGGAAQQLRALGPAARRVYTCSPACTSTQVPADFVTTNATLITDISNSSSIFGAGTSVTLSRVGSTVTGTTATDLGLDTPQDVVSITGASASAYNGAWTVNTGANRTFTFTVQESPVTPATGTMAVAAGGGVGQTLSAGAMTYNSAVNVVSVNLPGHGFSNGQTVTISGANVSNSMSNAASTATSGTESTVTSVATCSGWPSTATCEYNGTYQITVLGPNDFTYSPPTSNFGNTVVATYSIPQTFATPGSANFACKQGNGTRTDTIAFSSMTRTQSTSADPLSTTKTVTATVPIPASLANCALPLDLSGTGNGDGAFRSFSITGNSDGDLNRTFTLTSALKADGSACTLSANCILTFTVTVNSSSSSTRIVPASPATGTVVATGVPTRAVTSITRGASDASNIATVTVTTTAAHGFAGQTSVIVTGANQSEYNGTFTTAANSLAFPTTTTITYRIVTGPTTPATGTAAKGYRVDPADLVNWMRGYDNKEDENSNTIYTDVRASIHGDVLHSRPVAINYGGNTGIVVYYGANDGTFHAVKGGQASTDGVEKWSFVAPEHFPTLARLYNNSPLIKFPSTSANIVPTPTKRDYFFDGNIGVYQSADLGTTHIFVSARRGGRFIYAFDVSNPDTPKFLWKKTNSDYSEMGYTWSEPKVFRLRKTANVACSASDENSYTRALIFGAGYDPTEEDKANQGSANVVRSPTMGRGVFVLNAADGSLIKLLSPTDNKKYSFPAEVTLLDSDGDGCIDRVYAVDTGANIWRFDIGDADNTLWKTYKIAALGDTGNDGGNDDRKFLFPADAAISFIGNTQVTYLMVGSGNREEPRSSAIQDMFFMIRDNVAVGTDPASVTATVKDDLNAVTIFDNNNASKIDPTTNAFKGYYIPYDTGEKSVNAALTVAGVTFFGTNKPKAANANSCEPNLGIARGYAINFLSGTCANGDRNANGSVGISDCYADFVGGGLPPTPVSGVVKITDGNEEKTERFIIGSGGSGIEGSTVEGTRIQANPASNRTRVFWYFKTDE